VEWIRLQTEGSGRDKGLKERKEGRKKLKNHEEKWNQKFEGHCGK
jgi:hypothetical protein